MKVVLSRFLFKEDEKRRKNDKEGWRGRFLDLFYDFIPFSFPCPL